MERQDVLKEGHGETMQVELKVQVEVEVEVEAEDEVDAEEGGEVEVPIAGKEMAKIHRLKGQ